MPRKTKNILAKAKTQLLLKHPFFAQVVLSTRFKITEQVPTMATDGKWILVNPEYTKSLSIEEVIGVLAHEAMHILGMHHIRIQGHEQRKFDVAADYAINDLLLEEGFTLPNGGLHDKQYTNMSAEEVYSKLPNIDYDQQPGEVCVLGTFGNNGTPRDGETETTGTNANSTLPQDQITAEEQRIKELATSAAQAAKMQGKLPGAMQRLVDKLINVTTPWQDMLRKYMTRPAKNDYSWAVPNRRYIGSEMYMPAMKSDNGMGEVVVGVDMSVSISQRELSLFVSEVKQIVEDARPSSVSVVYFDSSVSHVDEFDEPSAFDISMEMHGGGGTDFRPVFDWVEDNQKSPDVIVMLTDLYGPTPDKEKYDTVWACLPNSNEHTPFGERVNLTFKE